LLKRHPVLSIRTPEDITAARVNSIALENIAKLFDIYEFEIREFNYPN
jgi:hypothetical protein